MWTPAVRAQLARDDHPYATSLTDQEWAVVAPFMPQPAKTGRPRPWPMRLVFDRIQYVLRAGCAWAHLPRDVPPHETVHRWFPGEASALPCLSRLDPVCEGCLRRRDGLTRGRPGCVPNCLAVVGPAMWTPEDRALVGDYGSGQRLTDDQWRLMQPVDPRCGSTPPAKPGGRPRTTDMRCLLDSLFYLLRTGFQWRHLPPAFLPWPTVYGYFRAFLSAGVWESMRHHLVVLLREAAGREPSPTAAIIDSQSVKTTEVRGAGMRPKRSWNASAISQWTRKGCCSASSCTPPRSRCQRRLNPGSPALAVLSLQS